jgi:hypothetical protein
MIKTKKRFCGNLPAAVLPLFQNHSPYEWKSVLQKHIPLWEKDVVNSKKLSEERMLRTRARYVNLILARLLVHLKISGGSEKCKLIALVESHLQYTDPTGRLQLKKRVFRLLVMKDFPEAIKTACKYPDYLTVKERHKLQIAA